MESDRMIIKNVNEDIFNSEFMLFSIIVDIIE